MKYQTISLYFFCSPNMEQRRDLLCNHSNGDLFTREDMFSRESSPGISLVSIVIKEVPIARK